MKYTMKAKLYFTSLVVLLTVLIVFWPNKPEQQSKQQAPAVSNADMDKIVSIIKELNFPPETEDILRHAPPEELVQFFTLTLEQKAEIREQNTEEEERHRLEEKVRARSRTQGVA